MAENVDVDRWRPRMAAAWAIRLFTVVVPIGFAVASMAILGHLLRRPHGGAAVAWYVLLFGMSWLVLWLTQRVLTRLLPLAVLLEMSLCFPERAPSRLKVAQRANSARELERLTNAPTVGPAAETTQQAAERILTLVAALARHDTRTRGHAERVRAFTDLIAERMSLPQADRDKLRWAALLHDIGKLEVPRHILNKPGKPTSNEWEVLRAHPQAGADIAAPLMSWLGSWGAVIVQHHERFDGTGYPTGLAGFAICQGARIVAVADTFEVMTASRSYKRPVKKEAALKELVRCAGSQFDPDVVRALVAAPAKRLLLVMGPSAWLAGLPLVGQAPAALTSTISAQATATLSAVTVASVTALAPQAAAVAPAHPTSTVQPMTTATTHVAASPTAPTGVSARAHPTTTTAHPGLSAHATSTTRGEAVLPATPVAAPPTSGYSPPAKTAASPVAGKKTSSPAPAKKVTSPAPAKKVTPPAPAKKVTPPAPAKKVTPPPPPAKKVTPPRPAKQVTPPPAKKVLPSIVPRWRIAGSSEQGLGDAHHH